MTGNASRAAEPCADGCARRGDPLAATAPPVSRWLLIEQLGPWGRNALRQSTLDADIVESLATKAMAAHVRTLLIRRPGRSAAHGPRRWALVDSRPGHEAVVWSRFDHQAELLGMDLDHPGGVPSAEPVYLVCTHGRHDRCCAMRGRPVASALAAGRPGQTWECSHVGGDRFAANVLVLPHGFYYGQVPVLQAPDLAARYEAGEIDPRWLRGRSSLPAPVQAAQHFARLRSGDRGVDSLPPLRHERIGHELWEVELAGPAGVPIRLTVRSAHQRSDTPLTCSATLSAPIRHFELVSTREWKVSS